MQMYGLRTKGLTDCLSNTCIWFLKNDPPRHRAGCKALSTCHALHDLENLWRRKQCDLGQVISVAHADTCTVLATLRTPRVTSDKPQ
eukprot:744936-Amphidinium_carterae.1